MTEREREDVAARRSLLRESNEHIVSLGEGWLTADGTIAVLCECGSPRCAEAIEVSRILFDAARAGAGRYVVKTGHEDAGRIVEQRDGYSVIEDVSSA